MSMMNPNIAIGFFIGLLLWGMWVYQIKTGKLLNGRWRIWATEKENPGLYWTIVSVQGFGILLATILLIRDALR